MNWLKRILGKTEPVTVCDGQMLTIRTTAMTHTLTPPVPRAEVIQINNPRLYLKRQAALRRAKAL